MPTKKGRRIPRRLRKHDHRTREGKITALAFSLFEARDHVCQFAKEMLKELENIERKYCGKKARV